MGLPEAFVALQILASPQAMADEPQASELTQVANDTHTAVEEALALTFVPENEENGSFVGIFEVPDKGIVKLKHDGIEINGIKYTATIKLKIPILGEDDYTVSFGRIDEIEPGTFKLLIYVGSKIPIPRTITLPPIRMKYLVETFFSGEEKNSFTALVDVEGHTSYVMTFNRQTI